MKGKDIFFGCLIAEGVRYLFGNPGTTEAPILDRIAPHPQLPYILALHEGAAVGMADAFALASGELAAVNLHAAPGLGNAIGMIFNAFVGKSPVLVTAGQQDTRMRLREPLLMHDLVAMARPVTKWSVQAESADELSVILPRAIRIAREDPCGPVFVSLPINVLEEDCGQPLIQSPTVLPAPSPDPDAISAAATMLLRSKSPIIVFGDGVHAKHAQLELIRLAEFLGARVWTPLLSQGVGFPFTHAQFMGELPDTSTAIRENLRLGDLLLLVGVGSFNEVMFTPESISAKGTVVIDIEPIASMVSDDMQVDLGIVGDMGKCLSELHAALSTRASQEYLLERDQRLGMLRRWIASMRSKLEADLLDSTDSVPMRPGQAIAGLREALPANTIVVGEALSAEEELLSLMRVSDLEGYYGSRGGGIGQGFPGGVGCKLAHPDRTVAVISGDGSALFSIQTLWTAAHHGIAVIFVVLNNQGYRIVKQSMRHYRKLFGCAPAPDSPILDIVSPPIEFTDLARGFGVPACKVAHPGEIRSAVQDACRTEGPYLLEIQIEA